MGKQTVHIRRINWDVEMTHDILTGNGFIISEKGVIDLDGQKKKPEFGPQSPRFGTTYGDEQEFVERWRCREGHIKGRMFEGEICPICGTKVEFRDVDVKQTGWVNLRYYKVINPLYFLLLEKHIGKKVFQDIIDTRQRVDRDGHIYDVPPEEAKEALSPFSGMGIQRFMENYEDVLNYFQAKKKDKYDEFEELKKLKSSVFTSNIPVYTTLLRPQSATSDTFYYTGIDRQINPLVQLSFDLDDAEEIEIPLILSRIQFRVNKMWEYNFQLINGKEGFIRNKLLGGDMNYSSRNVIIPNPELKDDEVDLSYQTFRIIFAQQIITCLMQQDHIPLRKAADRWKKSYIFDPYIYEIMKFIIKKDKPMILMNRNPTLNFYSILLLRVRKVKEDPEDRTLSVGLSVLPGLNADFDGDILNMFAIAQEEFKHMFRKFNPTERMLIDRATGLLNNYFALTKGQLIDLYHFATL